MDTQNATIYSLTVAHQTALRKLADTLDSGTIRQGFGALRITNDAGDAYMCCLGVAANIVDPTAWSLEDEDGCEASRELSSFGTRPTDMQTVMRQPGFEAWYWIDGRGLDEAGEMPDEVAKVYGIQPSGAFRVIGTVPDDAPKALRDADTTGTSLMSLNDGGTPFPEIAATIRYILDHPDVARFMPENMSLVSYDNKDGAAIPLPLEPMPTETTDETPLTPFYVTVRESTVYEVLAQDHEQAEEIAFAYRATQPDDRTTDGVDIEQAGPGVDTTHFLRPSDDDLTA